MPRSLKKWKPHHEMILSLHLQGKSNGEIAKIVDMSETSVSTTISSEQGQRIIRAANRRIRRAWEEDLEGKIRLMKKTALERIEDTLNSDFALGSDAKHHQDKIAMDYLKSTKTLAFDETNDPGLANAGAEVIKMLAEALEKANEVGADIDDMMGEAVPEVQEAEFEVLEGSEP